MLDFKNNLLRRHLLQGRHPAEWRNMGGSSRAVLVVSNPKTRPPFLRSSPTAAPASRHSDGPGLYTRCPCCRTGPAVRETPRRGPPLLALYLFASSRSSSAEERVSRQSHFLREGLSLRTAWRGEWKTVGQWSCLRTGKTHGVCDRVPGRLGHSKNLAEGGDPAWQETIDPISRRAT